MTYIFSRVLFFIRFIFTRLNRFISREYRVKRARAYKHVARNVHFVTVEHTQAKIVHDQTNRQHPAYYTADFQLSCVFFIHSRQGSFIIFFHRKA